MSGTCYDPLPPVNLVMGEDGNLKCVDGSHVKNYLKRELQEKRNVPVGTPMVVCTRELFEHLQRLAFLGHNGVA